MSREDRARVEDLLGHPELKWLIDRIERRMASGRDLEGTVTLRHPSDAERAAIDRLLGREPSRGTSLTVSLERIDDLLRRAEICSGLRAAVVLLRGPVVDRSEENRRLRETWRDIFDRARRDVVVAAWREWIDELEARGTLRRLARRDPESARQQLNRALRVLERLPAEDLPLAEFSARVLGDSHALDAGTPVATLVLAALSREQGKERPQSAGERREQWASVGVICDGLSWPVLTLGLPAVGTGFTDAALSQHAAAGEPYRISTRQLLRHPPTFDAHRLGGIVYVCENPMVVEAAAERLGVRCAPLVSIEGQPKTAARLLLTRLTESGVRLRYHGDFDWAGVRIANLIIERHSAEPWRLGEDDYRRATELGSKTLRGTPTDASWDAGLCPAMLEAMRQIDEEAVLEDLLEDLRM